MLALDLAGNYDPGAAIAGGVLGALAMLVVIYAGRAMAMTSMDLLHTLGTMLAPRASKTSAYAVGLMVHQMMGAAFGLVHAAILTGFDPTSAGDATTIGVLVGVVHGLAVTAAMPMMLTMGHPLVRHGDMTRPGVALTGFGTLTPVGVTLAHALFGLVTGAVYAGIVS